MAWFKTLTNHDDDMAGGRTTSMSVLTQHQYPAQRQNKPREAGTRVPVMGYEETVRAARKHPVECSPVFIEAIKERLVMTDYKRSIQMYGSSGKRLESIHAENPKSILSGIAVNENANSMFVCDAIGGSQARVQIFNIADEITPIVYLGQGLFQAPHGICTTNDNKILVTDVEKNEVYIIQEDGYNALCFGEKGKLAGQFIFPHDVVYDKEHRRIIVSDTHNHRIQAFSSEGQFLRTVEFDEKGKRLFNYPTGLKIDPLGNLVICQNGNDTLLVLDENLRPYHTLSTKGMGVQKPTSIAVLPYERLCISSCVMRCFVIF